MKKEIRDKLLKKPVFTKGEEDAFLKVGFEVIDKYQCANGSMILIREIETDLTYLILVEG